MKKVPERLMNREVTAMGDDVKKVDAVSKKKGSNAKIVKNHLENERV